VMVVLTVVVVVVVAAAAAVAVSMIVGALAWNADLLASGSRDRMIMLHDTRVVPVVPEKRLAGHRQEVCEPRCHPTSFLSTFIRPSLL